MTFVISRAFALPHIFDLKNGAGADAVNLNPQYGYATCKLQLDSGHEGIGLAFTLGAGTHIVCHAIEMLTTTLIGKDLHEVMASFGAMQKQLANMPNLRWLGPHKGVVHLALAAVGNACFDAWAKVEQKPLWKLLIDLKPEEIVALCDFSYLEDVVDAKIAEQMLRQAQATSNLREDVLHSGYQAYDTSIGWFHYTNQQLEENINRAIGEGFGAFKLKVGSAAIDRDVERAELIRNCIGENRYLMVDANQKWTIEEALQASKQLRSTKPYWIEEPTHPDDLMGHITLARQMLPMKIALGEQLPNPIAFKNYLLGNCMHFNQVDAVRVGGISDFITISLMSKKFDIPVVPHVGDMGQIHQHLVLFNHIKLDLPALFLEYIPHLRKYFKHPAQIVGGYYQPPQEAGASSEILS